MYTEKQGECGGFTPIIGWADIGGVKELAEMLLEFYDERVGEKDRFNEVSEELLSQALGDWEHHDGEWKGLSN